MTTGQSPARAIAQCSLHNAQRCSLDKLLPSTHSAGGTFTPNDVMHKHREARNGLAGDDSVVPHDSNRAVRWRTTRCLSSKF